MNSSQVIDAAEVVASRAVTRRDRDALYRRTFYEVVRAYARKAQKPLIAANNPDPMAQSYRRSPEDTLYLCDIEKATEQVCGDRLAWQSAWWSLVLDEPLPARFANEVILSCGKLYAARQLEPSVYFHRDKYAHRKAR